MSLEKWGIVLLTTNTEAEARDAIRILNTALAKLPITDDEKMAITFHYKHIIRQKEPIRRTYYVYVKNLPERYHGTMLRPQRS